MTEKGPSSMLEVPVYSASDYEALRAAAQAEIDRLTTERDEAWRFLACLALDGPLVVLARSQQVVPWEPEFERVELLDGAIYLRLRNAPRGSS